MKGKEESSFRRWESHLIVRRTLVSGPFQRRNRMRRRVFRAERLAVVGLGCGVEKGIPSFCFKDSVSGIWPLRKTDLEQTGGVGRSSNRSCTLAISKITIAKQ